HLEAMISFLEKLRPDRIEIAHTQYYGWALKNRAALMPTRAQVDNAVKIVASAAERLKGKIRIDSVVADYYARYPKPCMGGWRRQRHRSRLFSCAITSGDRAGAPGSSHRDLSAARRVDLPC